MSDDGWISSNADILQNLAHSLVPVENLVIGAAYLIGISFIMKALLTLKSQSESRGASGGSGGKEALVYALVGGMLLFFPSGFEVLMNTTFGYPNVLAYAQPSYSSPMLNSLFGADNATGEALALIIQVVGVFSFVRGWVLIARGASQGQPPGGTGKGLMHVFGGILAMNIIGTLQVINNTLYGAG